MLPRQRRGSAAPRPPKIDESVLSSVAWAIAGTSRTVGQPLQRRMPMAPRNRSVHLPALVCVSNWKLPGRKRMLLARLLLLLLLLPTLRAS